MAIDQSIKAQLQQLPEPIFQRLRQNLAGKPQIMQKDVTDLVQAYFQELRTALMSNAAVNKPIFEKLIPIFKPIQDGVRAQFGTLGGQISNTQLEGVITAIKNATNAQIGPHVGQLQGILNGPAPQPNPALNPQLPHPGVVQPGIVQPTVANNDGKIAITPQMMQQWNANPIMETLLLREGVNAYDRVTQAELKRIQAAHKIATQRTAADTKTFNSYKSTTAEEHRLYATKKREENNLPGFMRAINLETYWDNFWIYMHDRSRNNSNIARKKELDHATYEAVIDAYASPGRKARRMAAKPFKGLWRLSRPIRKVALYTFLVVSTPWLADEVFNDSKIAKGLKLPGYGEALNDYVITPVAEFTGLKDANSETAKPREKDRKVTQDRSSDTGLSDGSSNDGSSAEREGTTQETPKSYEDVGTVTAKSDPKTLDINDLIKAGMSSNLSDEQNAQARKGELIEEIQEAGYKGKIFSNFSTFKKSGGVPQITLRAEFNGQSLVIVATSANATVKYDTEVPTTAEAVKGTTFDIDTGEVVSATAGKDFYFAIPFNAASGKVAYRGDVLVNPGTFKAERIEDRLER